MIDIFIPSFLFLLHECVIRYRYSNNMCGWETCNMLDATVKFPSCSWLEDLTGLRMKSTTLEARVVRKSLFGSLSYHKPTESLRHIIFVEWKSIKRRWRMHEKKTLKVIRDTYKIGWTEPLSSLRLRAWKTPAEMQWHGRCKISRWIQFYVSRKAYQSSTSERSRRFG